MKPLTTLDQVQTPDGREMVLYQRGDAFSIEVDGENLMGSRAHGSEESLARLALEALGPHPRPRVLVGGLGMGFTLRAVLDALGPNSAKVRVAEAFAAVVAWNRSHLAHLAGRPLADPRVEIEVEDVGARIAASEAAFDVILLDVDNGPAAFTLDGNHKLYTERGIAACRRALNPGGVLAVWSADEDFRYADRLGRGGFAVKVRRVSARANGKGGRHVLFFGKEPS